MKFRRVILIVLDSVGIGEMPDAAAYGDAGSDTLGPHRALAAAQPAPLPRARFGQYPPARKPPAGARAARLVWPLLAGLARQGYHHRPLGDGGHTDREAVPALPARLSARDHGRIRAAHRPPPPSATTPPRATEIIQDLGAQHLATGSRSSTPRRTSVFQVAAHEDRHPAPRAGPHLRGGAGDSARAAPGWPGHRAPLCGPPGRLHTG